jgi:adenylylsulfate kinase
MSLNIKQYNYKITKSSRNKLNGHSSFLIWFTGLSGSGKSTLANLVEIELYKKGFSTYVLDGDNIRKGINKDLNFDPNDRTENLRRIGEVGNLMVDSGIITLAAFVSPYIRDRQMVKEIVGTENFLEIFINTSLGECERRDVKGLYKKARNGEINNMTGVSAPYEAPINPDFEIITDNHTVEESLKDIMSFINKKLKNNT